MNKIIIRCDDWDTRLRMTNVYPLHQEFVKRKIPMTVAVNNAMGGGYGHDPEVLKYMNESDPASWDIQLHGYEHERYWTYNLKELYRDMFANLYITKRDFIHSDPKIFYPPWNETSVNLVNVCKELGLTVKTSNRTSHEFLTWNNIAEQDCYYWHWWTPDDCRELPAVLDKLLLIQNK
jgi:peptidoglycan/xylan/chitin deacetylase (PgdA/CDA1 family)